MGTKSASRKQIPLKLAWALTIHKAQGMTLRRVNCDLRGVFETGQAYVAVSRAASLEGLRVIGLTMKAANVNHEVINFYNRLSNAFEVAKRLNVIIPNKESIEEALKDAHEKGWNDSSKGNFPVEKPVGSSFRGLNDLDEFAHKPSKKKTPQSRKRPRPINEDGAFNKPSGDGFDLFHADKKNSSLSSTTVAKNTTNNNNSDANNTNDKPICPHGKNCLRTISKHFEQFYHPPGTKGLLEANKKNENPFSMNRSSSLNSITKDFEGIVSDEDDFEDQISKIMYAPETKQKEESLLGTLPSPPTTPKKTGNSLIRSLSNIGDSQKKDSLMSMFDSDDDSDF
eukprot:TRINITY_DN1861_c0_g2_i1.p1 TRINITY_DN1861_c0_g2~~TRINITY_DN1861_c0_g2_i1.p1  ORF type:complete len:371 (-),score=106.70 TRINITY_DN1861_c0_g2_i1:113-1132(-)